VPLTLMDLLFLGLWFLIATSPYWIGALTVVLLFKIVKRARTGPAQVPVVELLPPAYDGVQFTNEEADLMIRKNIFFDGAQFRINDQKFTTLQEAVAASSVAEHTPS